MLLKGVLCSDCGIPVRHFSRGFIRFVFCDIDAVMDPSGTPGIETGLHTVLTNQDQSPPQAYPTGTQAMNIATPESMESPTVQSVTTDRVVQETSILDPAVPTGQRVEGLGEGYERLVDETPLHTRDINEYK